MAETGFVLENARLATLADGFGAYGLVDEGAIAVSAGHIAWSGARDALPHAYADWSRFDLGGRLITPGLIDCHTHLVFGGDRAREFEMRLNGASYEEIARAGGGIMSSVTATRAASEDELFASGLRYADALIGEGVTTLEIKSGYGLDKQSEMKMLRAARRIGDARDITVKTSFLGAHALPPEFKDRADAYIEHLIEEVLPAVQMEGLADAVDGFCEGIAFTPGQIGRLFDKAKSLGLPVKLHAEQLSNLGGAALAASYGALSADHLEYLDADGIAAMAKSGTVAVLLPGAFYHLRETKLPPVAELREAGVPIAIATDANPGSSPTFSLLAIFNMAATLFRMTPEEALRGATAHAARALGLEDRGVIAPGKRADLAVWDIETPAEFSYRLGFNPLAGRLYEGKWDANSELGARFG
ncbi:imidazolonepropionase [Cucumibacter marinus]|uniref:imidazolonepropionase n=1 Tax=Cucumibacter marinus TaxID=1121252 RepID=UPI00041FEB89|nr:imidazolonepropionase [Cucumibacter marinus]